MTRDWRQRKGKKKEDLRLTRETWDWLNTRWLITTVVKHQLTIYQLRLGYK